MKEYCIYMLTSPSGKSYIGQTCDLKRRLIAHQTSKGCISIYTAIKKYGFVNFKLEILIDKLAIEKANENEIKFILEYNTLFPNGYNLNSGGEMREPSDETRKKMSVASKARIRKPLSDETKTRISERTKGKKISEETRLRLVEVSKNILEKDPERMKKLCNAAAKANKGRKRDPELMEKLRIHNTGRKNSEETKLKMSMAAKGRPAHNKGKPWSDETRAKMSEAAKNRPPSKLKGRVLSEEHKARLKEASKKRWSKESMT